MHMGAERQDQFFLDTISTRLPIRSLPKMSKNRGIANFRFTTEQALIYLAYRDFPGKITISEFFSQESW